MEINIKNINDLLNLFNSNIKNIVDYLSYNNKKYILNNLCLEDKKKLLISILDLKLNNITLSCEGTRGGAMSNYNIVENININNFIFILLKNYYENFIIYPHTINIIHFILFNNLDIEKLLNVMLIIIYYKNYDINFNLKKIILKSNNNKNDIILDIFINNVLNDIYKNINILNININFNYNYNSLLLNNDHSSDLEKSYIYLSDQNKLENIKSELSISDDTFVSIDERINNLENDIKIFNDSIKNLEDNIEIIHNDIEITNNKLININNSFNQFKIKLINYIFIGFIFILNFKYLYYI